MLMNTYAKPGIMISVKYLFLGIPDMNLLKLQYKNLLLVMAAYNLLPTDSDVDEKYGVC